MEMPSRDLAAAAKRLNIPLWGRLLLSFLAAGTVAIGWGYWHLLGKEDNLDHAVRVLASKQPPDVNGLVKDLLAQAKTQNEEAMQRAIQPVSEQLRELGSKLNGVENSQKNLTQRIASQEAINRLSDPNRTLAVIRAELELARQSSQVIPKSQLVDYRNALSALPESAPNYWATVADVVNYQSLVNQLSGKAPDPRSASRPCLGITGQGPGFISRDQFLAWGINPKLRGGSRRQQLY